MVPIEPDAPFGIQQVKLDGAVVVLEAAGTGPEGRCPGCGAVSRSVHDRYRRRPYDVPWRGHVVRLLLTVRRFRCPAPECGRATFAGDFGRRLPRRARRTAEAAETLLRLARTVGGEVGARLATAIGVPASADTLLRLVRRGAAASAPTPRVLGVDDLALRRGHRYATILVDLETHRPIDLVPERTAEALAAWLREHPGVEVIVRDRSGAYAEGARAGAPNAIQVADRFHLLQNASAALDELLRARRRRIEWAVEPGPSAPEPASAGGAPEPPKLSPAKQRAAARRAARRARWEQVLALAAAGRSRRAIARELGINRRTVRRLLTTPVPPPGKPVVRPRPGGLRSPKLQPYVSYLQDRWQAGCTNVCQLFRELRERGYDGSRTLIDQALRPWRALLPPKPARPVIHVHGVRWLCLRPPDQLTPDEQAALAQLLADEPTIAAGHALVQEFRAVVATRDVAALDAWLVEAQASGLPSFVSLAAGIQADGPPVDAALRLPWSTGPVEGHVCRVKLIKRQGYGRARLDLLRARVLAG